MKIKELYESLFKGNPIDLTKISLEEAEKIIQSSPEWMNYYKYFGWNSLTDIKEEIFWLDKHKWTVSYYDVPCISTYVGGAIPFGSPERVMLKFNFKTGELLSDIETQYIKILPSSYKAVLQHMADLKQRIESEKWKYEKQHYIRFGRWHENERSKNYLTGDLENGVSVYITEWDHDTQRWAIESSVDEGTITGTMSSLILDPKKRIFLVTGDQIGEGSDGEPVLKNVKLVQELTKHDIFVPGIFDPGEFEDEID